MASLGGQTVASSFDRLLTLPAGGGDDANLVALSDGNEGTTFALKISTTDISVPCTGKVYLDGGYSTYITESGDGIISFYSNGTEVMKLDGNGNSELWTNSLAIGDENTSSPYLAIQSQESVTGTSVVHSIQLAGTGFASDVLLLGRADSGTSTNVVLNAKVGVRTHGDYPTGPKSDFHIADTTTKSSGDYGEFHLDYHVPAYGIGISSKDTASWDRSFGFLALNGDETTDTRLGGLHGYGTGETLTQLSIGASYSNANGIHWDLTNNRCGIGTTTPDCMLHVAGAFAASGPSETFSTFGGSNTTPDVSGANLWKTHASIQTLTDLHGGVAGQIVHIISTAAVTYDVTGTDLKGGSTDLVTADGDSTTWIYDGTYWYLIGFMDLNTDFNAMS